VKLRKPRCSAESGRRVEAADPTIRRRLPQSPGQKKEARRSGPLWTVAAGPAPSNEQCFRRRDRWYRSAIPIPSALGRTRTCDQRLRKRCSIQLSYEGERSVYTTM
jgi:hypothetical protein